MMHLTSNRLLQRGISLVEVLVAMVISTLIMVALAKTIDVALKAQTATREENDLRARSQFALNRISTTIMNATYQELPDKTDDTTSGSWLSPTYALSNGSVIESDSAGSRIIATDVSAFSITAPPVNAGRPYIVVSMTLSGTNTQLTSSTTARVGGAR